MKREAWGGQMQICDYSRSFVTFVTRGRGNNARLQVESVCTLTDESSGVRRELAPWFTPGPPTQFESGEGELKASVPHI